MLLKRLFISALVFLLVFAAFSCDNSKNNPWDSQAPKVTKDSDYTLTATSHYQGKSDFYYFGFFTPSPEAIEAAKRGILRTQEVLKQEYQLDQPGKPVLHGLDYLEVVFWKPAPICTSAPSFTVSYIPMAPNDPYDGSEYDKDPRVARVTICAAGKSSTHTWLNGNPNGGPNMMYRMDLVDGAGMTEPAARHEALHLGLLDVDPARYTATIYHGGDWEQILAKTDPNYTETTPRAPKPAGETVRIKGNIDGSDEEFGVVLVK